MKITIINLPSKLDRCTSHCVEFLEFRWDKDGNPAEMLFNYVKELNEEECELIEK